MKEIQIKKLKQNSAITLIALVITIIVLLILAGLTLTFVLGENGLFGKARQAKRETEIAQAEEDVNLRIIEASAENLGPATKEKFLEVLTKAKDKYMVSLNEIALLETGSITNANDLGSGDFYVTNVDKYPDVHVKVKSDFTIESQVSTASSGNSNSENTSSSSSSSGTVSDYTTNQVYRLNLQTDFENQDGITVTGSGVSISNDRKYVSFDGQSCLTVNNNTIDPNGTIRIKQNTTLCCWYRASLVQNWMLLLGFGDDGVDGIHNKHFLWLEDGALGAGQGFDTIGKEINPSNYLDNNWHFIVGVWKNNDTAIFYYDGVPFEATGTYTQSNAYLDIGGDYTGVVESLFKGDLTDVRIYDEALTETQVKQIYKWGKQNLGINY